MPPVFAPIITVPDFTDDKPNPVIDKIFAILEDLYENSGAKALLSCEKSAQTRGWKIDWVASSNANIQAGGIDISLRVPKIEWAPCGCYDTLEWPALSLGLGAVGGITQKLRRKAVRKIGVYIKDEFKSNIAIFRSRWYRFKNWGIGGWDKFVKLPPLQPGYKRLYRLNSNGITKTASDTNGWGTSRWFTDSTEYAIRHERFAKGATHVTYVDIPIGEASDCHMGNADSKWRKILAESGEQMNGGRGADPSKLIENPARFVGDESVAKNEYFLDSSYANQATKISQLTSLPDLEEFDNAWKKFENLFKDYDGEKFIDNPGYRNNFINRWETATSDLKGLCGKYFDNSDLTFDWLFKGNPNYSVADVQGNDVFRLPAIGIEDIFSSEKIIMKKAGYAIALIAFMTEIMSVTDVVRDKNCSSIGRDSTYGLTEKDKEFIREVRNTAIAKKEVTWAELDLDTCECSICPSGWNTCDNSSITNFYSSYGNTCHPPCCGDQEWKPITLIETCKCACPDGKVFMECECSDCKEGSGTPVLDYVTGDKRKKGICVDENPDPSKLQWDKKTCKWECKTTTTIQPPHLWGGFLTVPIEPPCKPDQQRKPNSCECSGDYSLEPCSESNISAYNIVPITEIRIV
jgi:hypothetical protein